MNKNDTIFITIILVMIIILVYLIIQFNHKEELCSENPLVYGVRELGEKNHAELYCTCSFNPSSNPLIEYPILKVNKEGMIIEFNSRDSFLK